MQNHLCKSRSMLMSKTIQTPVRNQERHLRLLSGIRNVILDSLNDCSGDRYQMDHFQGRQKLENLDKIKLMHCQDIPGVKYFLDSYQEPGTSSLNPWLIALETSTRLTTSRLGRDLQIQIKLCSCIVRTFLSTNK